MYSAMLTITEKLELWIPITFFVLLWAVMQWKGKLPSTDSIQQFVGIVNSRGGNIIILGMASVYFFKYSMFIFMDLLSMVRNKTISEDNAFALMAIQFVTTSAFGGAMGALLKTMTGENSSARSTDTKTIPPGSTTVSTSTFPLPDPNNAPKGNVTQTITSVAPTEDGSKDVKTAVINAETATINTETSPTV